MSWRQEVAALRDTTQVGSVIRRSAVPVLLVAIGAAALGAWLWSVWPARAANSYDLSIVYTGALIGELEPCGCAEESNVGGVKRGATMIERLRRDTPDLILVSGGGNINSNSWQDKVKAKYIWLAMRLMGYDSIGIQWRDLAYGAEYLGAHDLPLTNSNSIVARAAFSRTIDRGGLRLAHFSWLDPQSAQVRHAAAAHDALVADARLLNEKLREAKEAGAVTLVSTSVPVTELARHVDLSAVDLMMTSSPDEKYLEPQRIAQTLVLSAGTRGMRMAKLDLKLDAQHRIAAHRHEVFKLTRSVPDASALATWYDDYNAEIKSAYQLRAEQRKQREANHGAFVGAKQCELCHRTTHASWRRTKHAAAFKTLESVNKQFDPECIGCHTVGFEQAGGFIDLSVSRFLIDVQCESCHGAARAHVDSGGAQQTSNAAWKAEQMCRQCHYGDHSPGFELATYWPAIAHGKEGESTW